MRINKFQNMLESIKGKILGSSDEYIKLLKVIGYNQRYNFLNQLSIYNREPEAIACAKYSFWYDNLNRSVKARERGIPIIDSYKRIDYIFDISQTESRNMNVNNEVTLWQFNVDKDDSALKEIITKKGYNISEDPIENIQTLTSIHGAKEVFELMSELGIGYEKSVEFTDFLFNSVTYSVAQRFNISYNIDKEMIESSLKKLDSISLVGLGNAISNISKNVIEETISKTKKIEKDMELENKKNREEGVKDDNRLSTTILRGEELQGDSSRSTEDSSSGELSGYIRGNEYHRGNSSSSDGENKRRTVRLFPDEVRLYDDERERGTPEDGSGTIQGEQIDSTSFRSGRDGREDLGHGKTENDRVLGADRGTQETKSTEVQRADEQFKFIIERDSDKGSSGELKNNHEAKREVEETSLLFSTENNKNVVNAVKVGAVFILVSPEEVNHISLKSTKIVIDIEGKEYELYSGKTFEESQKVDRLIYDNSIKTYNISEYENKNTESIQNDIIEDSDAREIDEPIKNLNNSILQVGMEIKYEDEIYKIESINKEKPPFSIKLKGEDILENLITSSTVLFFENEKELLDKFDIIHSEIEESKNFSFDGEMLSGTLAPSERLNNNIKAIETLLKIETKDRNATIEEQKILSKYVGWGGLSEVFDESKEGQWKEARLFLKKNLSYSEYDKAKESTLTSFYTPNTVIKSIYNTLSEMGYKKGNVLEPSLGTGAFIGNVPEELSGSKFYGVELDSVSGRIAKKLYPESDIQVKGFEDTTFSNNFFDVAIGNVPFGDFSVNDRDYNKNKLLIHDYFFAKSLDKVRNGGIVAFITSSGTMDKKDESVRRYLSSKGEFLGALRLPNNTFKGVAGTEVTSDIIFLKKRDSVLERENDWIYLDTDENGNIYNKYFVDNPHMVLGDMKEVSGRFGNTLTCVAKDEDLGSLLENRRKYISDNFKYEEVEIENEEDFENVLFATDDIKNFSFTIIDDEIYYRENSILVPRDVSDKNKAIIRDYLEVVESLKVLIDLQRNDGNDEEIKESQDNLNKTYDEFSKNHGHINKQSNERVLREDGNYPLVSSIEILESDPNNSKREIFKAKGDIFYKRTITKATVVKHVDTSIEALVLSMSENGRVDFDYMSDLTDKDKNTLIDELKGEIYLDIKDYDESNNTLPFSSSMDEESMSFRYVPADEYLSGNIREKLKTINKYINSVGRQLILLNQDTENEYTDKTIKEIEKLENEKVLLQYQKDKLKEVMPEDLKASEINVRLGATWIPEKDIEKFVFEKLETSWYLQHDIKVEHSEITGEWRIDGKSSDTGNTLSEVKYGTSRVNAYKIIENALNLRDTKVYDRVEDNDGKVRSVLNKKETMLANQRQDLINEEFKNWIFDDLDRRAKLEKIYNEKFNSIRNREYDGSNLKFDGMNPEINLRKHQRNAIARSLYGGNTLHAHVVGAGKTYTMIADAMESKRLGLASKSLFTVPNHITTQFGREFMQLYPGANILVANKKDFEPKNRKRFIGKIATGEYDAVILGHSQFEKIMMSKKYQTKHIQDQIDDIVESLEKINYMRGTSFTVKQMEKTKKQLETRLEKLNDDYMKDDVITFEELGVDKLFVDEAHNYKNLYLHTKMQNVAGVGQSKALKSSDMFMKCRYMDEITGGKGIVFATGTPVSNSMTELYTMQRYLQYDALKKNGLEYFDSWASTFGETVTAFELSPEGTKYRMKTRFSKFYNLPELMSMFKETADIQTANMLNLPVPKANYRVIKTEPTEEQKEILKEISNRADNIRNGSVPPEVDNMLKITNDGKKLALDQRLINPLLPDDPNSKLNVCMKNVFKIWEESKENSSAQLIFSDMSTPKSDTFNVYDDIKEKLIGLGVPEKEIAFIHDANTDKQKDELFNKVRKGDIRVLLGSTQKMGSGTNAQDKLIALHDLDVPWRPSDLEQRSGRIVRQGNKNKEVDIYRYVTTNTFDSYLWQTIENKQKFISQIMTSKTPVRVAEDVDESSLNYAEIKALATGNPLIKEKMELDNEVTKLRMMESSYKSSRYSLEDKVHKKYPRMIKQYTELINKIKKDIENVEPQNKDKDNRFTSLTVDGVKYEDKEEAGKKLMEAIKSVKVNQKKVIGSYRKMDIVVSYNYLNNEYEFTLLGEAEHSGYFGTNELGNIERMDNRLNKMDERTEETKNQLQRITENLKKAKLELDKPFEKEEELKEKTNRLAEINRQLEMADEDLELSESEQIEKLDVSFNNSTVIALENSFEI